MKVIGAGFGRTGTLSLRAALCEPGFGPCHHMTDVTADPALADKWLRKARGEDVGWNEILGGYASIVDWPGCFYWQELLDHFPHAKVILTVRDAGAWYRSAAETIYAMAQAYRPPGDGHAPGMSDLIIWQGTFGGRFAERDYALRVFADHYRRVISAVPRQRLLVYDIRAGWGPLCEFLGANVPPGISFPHRNDRASFPAIWQPGNT
ncbi:MAG: sulfotransferase family protein [Streptosporangiaceae bacterium]|jgi:hypothetical protein